MGCAWSSGRHDRLPQLQPASVFWSGFGRCLTSISRRWNRRMNSAADQADLSPGRRRTGASRPGVAQDRGLDGAHGVSEAIPDLRGPRHGVGSSALSRRKAAFPTRPMQQSIGTAWRPSMSSRVRCAIAPESHREPVDTWGQRGSALARPGHALAKRMRLAEDHPGAPAG